MKQGYSRHQTLHNKVLLRGKKQIWWALQLPCLTNLRAILDHGAGVGNLGQPLELKRWTSKHKEAIMARIHEIQSHRRRIFTENSRDV